MDNANFKNTLTSKKNHLIGFILFLYLSGICKNSVAEEIIEGKHGWQHDKCPSFWDPSCPMFKSFEEACQAIYKIKKDEKLDFQEGKSDFDIGSKTVAHCYYNFASSKGKYDIERSEGAWYHLFCPDNSYYLKIDSDQDTKCVCRDGYKASGNQCIEASASPYAPPDPEKSLGQNSTDTNAPPCQEGQFCGNPINNTTGNKYESEQDYAGTGPFSLNLTRHYNSQPITPTRIGLFGANWSDDFSGSIKRTSPTATEAKVIKSNGQVITFKKDKGVWSASDDVLSSLTETTDATGNTLSWRYTTGEDNVETYNALGQLTRITNRVGLTQKLNYDASQNLASVSDSFGRTLTFIMDARNRVATVKDPAGQVYGYGYDDTTDNLTSVTYPDGQSRKYLYEDTTYPHAMTGLIDENGVKYASWKYDDKGRAYISEHFGGADKVSVEYDMDNGKTTIKDALDRERSYRYQTLFGSSRTVKAEKPSPKGGDGATASSYWEYDDNGNIKTFVDYSGNRTTYSYDLDRNLETSRTEADGTSVSRTIDTEWHPNYRLPTKITELNKVTTYEYDDHGNVKKITITSDDKSRIWSFKYNDAGQLKEENGPRTDVSDITQYDYDDKGNLKSITNALGQVTSIPSYDAHGHPLTIIKPNGLAITLTYDKRGHLTSTKNGEEEKTLLIYDGAVLLSNVINSLLNIEYSYDDAHRLREIYSNGRHYDAILSYKLDKVGNRIKEDLVFYDKDRFPTGDFEIKETRSYKFDALDRITNLQQGDFGIIDEIKDIFGVGTKTTTYEYDDEDNLMRVTDALNNETRQTYDPLNRLSETTRDTQTVTYDYDNDDNVISITDPLRNITKYTIDGFGDNQNTESPDTGNTENELDSAGNLIYTVNAENKRTDYTYDALNRITSLKYPEAKVVFSYDQGANNIGHLTQMTDATGKTTWEYDALGRVSIKTIELGATKLTVLYSYNKLGQLESETYPSGHKITYQYSDGTVSGININNSALIKYITHRPFGGPPASWEWSNGTQYQRIFDTDGNLTKYDLGGGRIRELKYDLADRITDFNYADTTLNTTFDFDNINRLKGVKDSTDQKLFGYDYDANGNRQSLENAAGQTDTYVYADDSNRLLNISGTKAIAFDYDNAGNIKSDGINQFTYDGRGRLVTSKTTTGTFSYGVNGLGERVSKLNGKTGSYYIYDEAGHLLGEYDLTGKTVHEYVWLEAQPVAVISSNSTYNIYVDHLNTPRAIADNTNKIIWRWEGEPFGNSPAQEDPDGDGVKFTLNLRSPGQYFDTESGLHYNYFRDYNPATGRYIESDPIGLAGGKNTYNYAEVNPVSYTDLDGLAAGVYDVLGEARLNDSMYRLSDPKHFQEANRQLYYQMKNNAQLKASIESRYPGTFEAISPGKRGAFPRTAPPDLTWHHHEKVGGLLQLVDQADHKRFKDYHPTGRGGRNSWGGGSECR